MQEIFINIFGGYSLAYWTSAFFFGMVGFILHKFLTYNPNTKETSPNQFNLTYWLQNNWLDIFGGLFIFFAWIRFKNEILETLPENPLVVWFKVFTDSFFIHLAFGMFSTIISKSLRKFLKKQ